MVDERVGVHGESGFDTARFPSVFPWLHLREVAYAAGFEPSTHPVQGEAAAREHGSMTLPAPGGERECTTAFRVGRLD
ncbi:DUF4432 family protein [Streptomyces violaceorubidus]|uniref:DUF4432 family protein n=1 Tax=Streptomyces violaceorubidus TaxID=284042 RepID=UPI001FD7FB08|nr:DUF4432 family protein [Streptomyces violaceorubidus]